MLKSKAKKEVRIEIVLAKSRSLRGVAEELARRSAQTKLGLDASKSCML